MDDVDRGLTLLVPVAPFLTQWTLESLDDWLAEHGPITRTRMSLWTRDNYIYDQIIGRAETATNLPVPIRVPRFRRMRWLLMDDGDLSVAVWMKKVDPETLLTSIYPTATARRRQRDGREPLFREQRNVLFVCGHTIEEDIAGLNAWIGRVVLTRESRDIDGVRHVTLARPLYYQRTGPLALTTEDQQLKMTFAQRPETSPIVLTSPASKPPRVRPKPGRERKRGDTGTPIVGTNVARRDAERLAAEEAEKKQKEQGPQGA